MIMMVYSEKPLPPNKSAGSVSIYRNIMAVSVVKVNSNTVSVGKKHEKVTCNSEILFCRS